jgi:hypothetical protein
VVDVVRLRRLGCIPERVFDIAGRIMRGTLGLVELAFVLKFLVIHDLAGGILDGALHLIGSALHMFAIHSVLLFVVGDYPVNAQRSQAFPPPSGEGQVVLKDT